MTDEVKVDEPQIEKRLKGRISRMEGSEVIKNRVIQLIHQYLFSFKQMGEKVKEYGEKNPPARNMITEICNIISYYEGLKKYAGYESFRVGQLEAIIEIMRGFNCLVIMPTGGGKSMIYQLPALLEEPTEQFIGKTTIVNSFLLALTEDQMFHLAKKGLRSGDLKIARFDSTVNNAYKSQVICNIKAGLHYHMIYVTPETFINDQFQYLVKLLIDRNRLGRIVVDEAHLIDQWGRKSKIRPSVLKIGCIKKLFPSIQIVAFTATATEDTKTFIKQNLHIEDSVKTIYVPLNRPNITYRFTAGFRDYCLPSMKYHVQDFIRRFKHLPRCITYVFGKNDCKSYCEKFTDMCKTLKSDYYHADRTDAEKTDLYKRWCSGELHNLFATTAFGLGIDSVVHIVFILDAQDEAMINQMGGRVGRNGEQAYCYVYVNKGFITRDKKKLLEQKNFYGNHPSHYVKELTEIDDQLDAMKRTEAICVLKANDPEYPLLCRRKLLLRNFSAKEFEDENMNCLDHPLNSQFDPCDVCLKRKGEKENGEKNTNDGMNNTKEKKPIPPWVLKNIIKKKK